MFLISQVAIDRAVENIEKYRRSTLIDARDRRLLLADQLYLALGGREKCISRTESRNWAMVDLVRDLDYSSSFVRLIPSEMHTRSCRMKYELVEELFLCNLFYYRRYWYCPLDVFVNRFGCASSFMQKRLNRAQCLHVHAIHGIDLRFPSILGQINSTKGVRVCMTK